MSDNRARLAAEIDRAEAETAAREAARTPGEIRRTLAARDNAVLRAEAEAWEDAYDAWERARNRRAGLALAAYALALLALVAGLAWLIERLPPGAGSVVAVGGTVGMAWVGLGGPCR